MEKWNQASNPFDETNKLSNQTVSYFFILYGKIALQLVNYVKIVEATMLIRKCLQGNYLEPIVTWVPTVKLHYNRNIPSSNCQNVLPLEGITWQK